MSEELRKLKNIGSVSADMLQSIGIHSRRQLDQLGAVEVYRRLRTEHLVSKNMLWALQGALMNLPYNQLPPEIKQSLLDELESGESCGQ